MRRRRRRSKRPERTRKEAFQQFFQGIYEMGKIAFDAAPRILIGMLTVRLIQGVIPVTTAFLAKLIFDRLAMILQAETSLSFQTDMLPLILIFGATIIISEGLRNIDTYLNTELGQQVELHMSELIYGHLQTFKGMTYFESPRFHDTLRQAAGRLNHSPSSLVSEISSLLSSMITLVSFFGVVLVFSPFLAGVLVIAIIPNFIMQMRFRSKRFNLSWFNSPKERKAYYLSDLLSSTRYAKETRLFNLGDYFLQQFIETKGEVLEDRRRLLAEETRANTALSVISALVTVSTYIIVIARAFAQVITLGDVTLYLEAVRNVQGRLGSLSSTIVRLNERTLFFTHFQDLMAFKPTLEQRDPQPVPPLQSKIELCNVSFRYDENSPYVIKNMNLTIYKGESLALVGLNGAGKTTIVKLLSRFYDPTEGAILWDGIDIRHFKPDELRQRIGAVLQDFVQFDLNARENIGLGDVRYIEELERVRAAAVGTGVDSFIEALPQGYETILSRWLVDDDDEGTDLSGGQWQKIAIARAYMRNVDLLMLDEPTAALDAEAEHDIYERFAELTANRASVLISHRFSTVRMADKIAVIEDGEIKEYGTHQELMALNQTYAHLYSLQAAQYFS